MGSELTVGHWLVEPDLNLISNAGRSVSVEPKVMEVLIFLAEHAGEVLSRDKILRTVWSGTHVSAEVLTYSISELRKAFDDSAKNPQIIQTIPRRGYRLIAPVSGNSTAESVMPAPAPIAPAVQKSRLRGWIPAIAGVTAVLVLTAFFFYLRWSSALTQTDFILLTDFINATEDPVFDSTLKLALAVHLQQSPFLNVVSDEKVRDTLRLMGRSPADPVTKEAGREICARQGIKAMIAGSISSMGRNYVISLEALNGQTGDAIARAQIEVTSKEEVLKALGNAATQLRRKLGESLKSIESFDVPLEQATTSSLDAFKAYSLGRKSLSSGDSLNALSHFKRAVELDANFASAYRCLAWCYRNLQQPEVAAEFAKKAFDLRERASEYEKLSMMAAYYSLVTGERDSAIETIELLRSTYPRVPQVHNTLGSQYASIGNFEKAIESYQEAIRLNPYALAYANLASAYISLSRFEDAKRIFYQARAHKMDSLSLRLVEYQLALIQGDSEKIKASMDQMTGRPEEHRLLTMQAGAAHFSGMLRKARELGLRAAELARRQELKEAAAEIFAGMALRECIFAEFVKAREYGARALALSRTSEILYRVALSRALHGDVEDARMLVAELEQSFPKDLLVNKLWLPTIQAAIEVQRGYNFQAIQALQSIGSYESVGFFWPNFIRGLAYLGLGDGVHAAAEFQKIVGHRGWDPQSGLFSIAHLYLGRAEKIIGDTAKSRRDYQDFFVLWKDADPDLPVLAQARSEFSGLK